MFMGRRCSDKHDLGGFERILVVVLELQGVGFTSVNGPFSAKKPDVPGGQARVFQYLEFKFRMAFKDVLRLLVKSRSNRFHFFFY